MLSSHFGIQARVDDLSPIANQSFACSGASMLANSRPRRASTRRALAMSQIVLASGIVMPVDKPREREPVT